MIYELDVSKWICGKGESSLGFGAPRLLNDEGYMCCLGQFAKQKGVEPEKLLDKGSPRMIDYMYDDLFRIVGGETNLALALMCINDSYTTPIEKIASIRERLEESGHELKVINSHLLGKWKDEKIHFS